MSETDKAQTGTLLVTEGYPRCTWIRGLPYMYLRIGMCDKEALKPAAKTFRTKIVQVRGKKVECPPRLFPPDGKGRYMVQKGGRPETTDQIMKELEQYVTKEFINKYKEKRRTCTPKRPRKRRPELKPRKRREYLEI